MVKSINEKLPKMMTIKKTGNQRPWYVLPCLCDWVIKGLGMSSHVCDWVIKGLGMSSRVCVTG